MPTQEEINAANVELQIANDNYAALANKYNNYMAAFKGYADASPETKARLQGTMEKALADFDQLKLNMYAAEDRIAQAQNRVNDYANIQPAVVTPAGGQRRRQVVPPTNDELRLQQYLNAGYYVGDDGLMYTPSGIKVRSNGYNLNNKGEWVEAPIVVDEKPVEIIQQEPADGSPIVQDVVVGPQNYYDTYSQMKATGAVGPEYTQYFRQFGIPTSHTSWLVRNDLINNKGLTTQQANDFVWDWSQATMAPNAQYSLTSPQRVRSNPGSHRNRQIQTWGTVNPNDPRLLTNR